MENKESIIEAMKFGGISERESKVLLAMNSTGKKQPVDIAKEAGVPQSKIYEVLSILEEKNFIVKKDKEYELKPNLFESILENIKFKARSLEKNLKILNKPKENEEIKTLVQTTLKELEFSIGKEEYIESELNDFFSKNMSLNATRIEATSPNSGNKVAIYIIPPTNKIDFLMLMRGEFFNEGFNTYFFITDDTSAFKDGEFPPIIETEHIGCCDYKSDIKKHLSKFLEGYDAKWSVLSEEIQRINLDELMVDTQTFDIQNRIYRIQEKTDSIPGVDDDVKFSIRELTNRIITDFKMAKQNFLTTRYRIDEVETSINNNINLNSANKTISKLPRQLTTIKDKFINVSIGLDKIDEELTFLMKGKDRAMHKLGYNINPFFFIATGRNPEKPVNQVETNKKIIDFVKNTTSDKMTMNGLLLTDQAGMGKSHLLRYTANTINSEQYGKAVAIYVKCLQDRDLLYSLQTSIAQELQNLSKDIYEKVRFIVEKSEKQTTIHEFADSLRTLTVKLSESGYESLFIIIDEFENAIPSDGENKALFRSFKQLTTLMGTYHISYIVSIRRESFEKQQEEIKKIFTAEQVLGLNKFTSKEFEMLFNTRLDNKTYHNENKKNEMKIKFSLESIQNITKKSGGNIREGLKMAQMKFRLAAQEFNENKKELII